MGTVERVYDRQLRRELARKVVRGASDPRSISRFLDEARITAQLQHPGIPPVHELGTDRDGRLWYTMPFVPGRTLGQIAELVQARDPEWPLPRVLGVLLKVCEAVAFAHSRGVIHRDLKPSNVMVGQFGETYVMDWGLASVSGDAEGGGRTVVVDRAGPDEDSPLATRDGDVVGTPAYMPPEQARGELDRIGRRVDVYAAGAMLYHLLAGVPRKPPVDCSLSEAKPRAIGSSDWRKRCRQSACNWRPTCPWSNWRASSPAAWLSSGTIQAYHITPPREDCPFSPCGGKLSKRCGGRVATMSGSFVSQPAFII
jgi:serine/threonine protein kinase